MPRLLVPTTPCFIDYNDEPDDGFVQRFTAHKQRLWGAVNASIDIYIGEQVGKHIAASSSKKQKQRAKSVAAYTQVLQGHIDAQVNRGLAIIAFNPDVITYSGPYAIVETQVFEFAIKELLADFGGFSGADLRRRRVQSRHWVDACAFELSQSFFGRRL